MKIAILGFGEEGKSVLRFLKKDPSFRSENLEILDKKLNQNYLNNLSRFDIIFRSPGVPYSLPEIQSAKKKGVKISSATKLFFEQAAKRGIKIIGVTGSKGKTTTATLIYKMLKAGGKRIFLAGNIGKSPLDLLRKLRRNDWVVLELSSFQLQDLESSPKIAVLLELFPEHLDINSGHGGHKNLKEYYSAKANIVRFQKKNDAVFFLKHNPTTARIARLSQGKKFPISEKDKTPFNISEIKLIGLHMYRNALAAAAVAKYLGVSDGIIKKTARTFRGIEHRLEFVRRIKEIEFYNDSIATNPEAAAAAIQSFPNRNVILLAGGFDKNLNYASLNKALRGSSVRLILLYGQNKKKIQKAVSGTGLPIKIVSNLNQALKFAYQRAKKMRRAVILLSPAAASFDQFRGYAERGEKFKDLVRKLK